MIKKEFCAENFNNVPEAIEAGIARIELCDRLDVGGTTPSGSVQRQTVQYAHQQGVEVLTMIRPRGGSFVYTDEEKLKLIKDARFAIENETDGIVFGCLTRDKDIDKPIVEELIKLAGNKQSVFHMAFDAISEDKQTEALEWLIEAGCTRILTRGGVSGSALSHQEKINAVIKQAASRIEILPGGGITFNNLKEAEEKIDANQFHGTQIVDFSKDH